MPRSSRLLAPWVGQPGAGPAIYHCVSRVVNREKVLKEVEKEEFVRLVRLYERFCGVHILTYWVMSNHFHLLVEVPPRPAGGLSDRELCQRLALIKGEAEVAEVRELLQRYRKGGNEAGAVELRERFLYRMWDLSQFMKSLKQCFTTWFNRRHNWRGTLWEERFKNVLVEDGYAARVMAAYIDLNPIRAGMVDTPERYRWCGYAAAVARRPEARAGIERLMEQYEQLRGGKKIERSWAWVAKQYRVILFTDGEERYREEPVTGSVEVARRGIRRQDVERVLKNGGKLSPGQMLRCRVRALSDGAVIGTRKFLEEFFNAKREFFGPRRKSGARPIYGCEIELCSARALRKDALG